MSPVIHLTRKLQTENANKMEVVDSIIQKGVPTPN